MKNPDFRVFLFDKQIKNTILSIYSRLETSEKGGQGVVSALFLI
ncbi:hypothetical protein HMPREF0880_00214 [Yokenella regensburgei ATCC 43003]|nr:hypothetical protein HMPREF0880_00214 [Yokenella regensburgei ATCC 43003]